MNVSDQSTKYGTGIVPAMSNRFSCNKSVWGYSSDVGLMLQSDNGALMVRINSSSAPTLEDFKTWLSNNNVEVIYELATPITTEITDETMIQGLESIKTFTGTTNITSDILMTGSYVKDINKVIADLTNLLTANSES